MGRHIVQNGKEPVAKDDQCKLQVASFAFSVAKNIGLGTRLLVCAPCFSLLLLLLIHVVYTEHSTFI